MPAGIENSGTVVAGLVGATLERIAPSPVQLTDRKNESVVSARFINRIGHRFPMKRESVHASA
ncbi:hypothetical protein [Roseixanthobacter glucoisosaccharinicivorans]|uniref:hypothetical protein n=1 Tax=Roseixanthobacter glucoisosaccharinicivorans TaxID=3119923 RepID=UPI00372B7ECA